MQVFGFGNIIKYLMYIWDIIRFHQEFSTAVQILAFLINRPHLIYQYSNMTPRLSGQTYLFGVVFFVSKSLSGIERQKNF